MTRHTKGGRKGRREAAPVIQPGGVYTQREAILLLRMGQDCFRGLVAAGEIPPGRKVGTQVLYLGEVLMDWLRRKAPKAQKPGKRKGQA